jgi:maltose-binding protein MalE
MVLAAVVVLAGCGGRAPSGGGGGGSEGGELTLWTHNAGNKEELAVVNQIVSDYNASQTQNQVKVQAFPQAAYNDAVTAAATAKKLPCILDVDAPIVPNWAWAGYLTKLDLPQELVAKQLPSTLGKWKDQLYSIGLYDAALGLFARKSALDAAGVRVATLDQPWNAQEFTQALDKIKASGKFSYVLDLGTGDATPEWWTYGYSPFLQSFGGDLIDRNSYTTASGVLNGDKAIAWANWLQGLVKNKYTPAKSGTDAFADFVNGKSAMVWSGIWNAGNLAKVKDGVVMPPPDLGAGPKIGGGLLAVGDQFRLPERGRRAGLPEVLPESEVSLGVRDQAERHSGDRGGRGPDARLEARRAQAVLPRRVQAVCADPAADTGLPLHHDHLRQGGPGHRRGWGRQEHPGSGGQQHRSEPQEQQQLRLLILGGCWVRAGRSPAPSAAWPPCGERHGCHPRNAAEKWPSDRHTSHHQETHRPRP